MLTTVSVKLSPVGRDTPRKDPPVATDRFPIEQGHIMLFARSVGDDNPIYHDPDAATDTEPGHVIPPPTFVQASAQFTEGYNLRPVVGQPWFGSGKEPTGVKRESSGEGGGTGFHAEQHYEYHSPIQPGDVLKAVDKPGKSWTREGRRGGSLSFNESVTEYYNQDDVLVVTARSVGVQTSRVVE